MADNQYIIITLNRPIEILEENADGDLVPVEHPTEVPDESFKGRGAITEAHLDGFLKIGERAFFQCESLVTISIPDVVEIKDSAFKECTNIDKIVAPNLTTIGNHAFGGCKFANPITIPKARTIGYNAFEDCAEATQIVIDQAVSIDDNAFRGCLKVNKFSAWNLTTLGDGVFYNCEKIPYLILPFITSIGEETFVGCSSLTKLDLPHVSALSQSPDSESVFAGCSNLEHIYLPNVTLAGLPSRVFSDCTNLKYLNLQGALNVESATSVWRSSLGIPANCKIICSDGISFPSSSPMIKPSQFEYDTSSGYREISELKAGQTIPEQLWDEYSQGIKCTVFQGNTVLKKLKMPNLKVPPIAEAFKNCTNLDEVYMPLVLGFGENAFEGCTHLNYVQLNSIPRSVVVANASTWKLRSGCTVVCSDATIKLS